MIFLDTDILSYYFSGNMQIRDKMKNVISDGIQICLTSINVYEILKGLRYNNNEKIEKSFNGFISNITVYSLDDEATHKAAEIYAALRKSGKPLGDADILIASIVIVNFGKLITNNVKHYQNISGLQFENWLG